MSTVYVALRDYDYNNYGITGIYAELQHAKATVAAEYERPDRTLEWREDRDGSSWNLYAVGHVKNPDHWLDVIIEAHEVIT